MGVCAGGVRGQGWLFGDLHEGLGWPARVADEEQASERCGGPSARSPILGTLRGGLTKAWWTAKGSSEARGTLAVGTEAEQQLHAGRTPVLGLRVGTAVSLGLPGAVACQAVQCSKDTFAPGALGRWQGARIGVRDHGQMRARPAGLGAEARAGRPQGQPAGPRAAAGVRVPAVSALAPPALGSPER